MFLNKNNFLRMAILILVILFSGCSNLLFNQEPKHIIKEPKDKTLLSLKKGKIINIFELVKEVEHYPIIFIGDKHNNNKTHEFFLNFLKELLKKNYNLYLANEWFTINHNTLLNNYINNKINNIELKEKRNWNNDVGYKWNLVKPIYETIKNSGNKLYGINISKKDKEKISLKDFKTMSKELKIFYKKLDFKVSSHQSLIMPFLKNCYQHNSIKSNENCEKRMYRIQVAWDTFMAEECNRIANKVIKTKKDKLIIFAGELHINYGVGIPLRFSRLNNLPSYIISNEEYIEKKILQINLNKANTLFIYKKD